MPATDSFRLGPGLGPRREIQVREHGADVQHPATLAHVEAIVLQGKDRGAGDNAKYSWFFSELMSTKGRAATDGVSCRPGARAATEISISASMAVAGICRALDAIPSSMRPHRIPLDG